MMHPDTELRTVSPEIGVGVFAKTRLPKGTITYILDPLEIVIPADDPMLQNPTWRRLIDIYAIIKPDGSYELSWDLAKYMNHCCHYNTVSTGFDFDIAIRDIEAGEEITCDYGMFNINYPMDLRCDFADCRKKIYANDYDRCLGQWDRDAIDAMAYARSVPQRLLDSLDPEMRAKFEHYAATGEGYISVDVYRRLTPAGNGVPAM